MSEWDSKRNDNCWDIKIVDARKRIPLLFESGLPVFPEESLREELLGLSLTPPVLA